MSQIIYQLNAIQLLLQNLTMRTEQIKQNFGLRLREALQDKWPGDRIQAEWAKHLDVSTATLSDWLNGNKMPGTERLIEICLNLDVCIEWLFTGRGSKKPQHMPEQDLNLTEEQKNALLKIIGLGSK